MAIKLPFTVIIILLISCNPRQNTNTTEDIKINADTSKQIQKAIIQVDNNVRKTDESKILGSWTDGSSENATFDIKKDSIFYVDQFATYNYSLIGDSIKIKYPDWTFSGLVTFTKDTMVVSSEDGTTKYWKFKD